MGGRGVLDEDRYSREEERLNMAERHSTQTRVYYRSGLNMGYIYRDAGWGCLGGLKRMLVKAPEQRNETFRAIEWKDLFCSHNGRSLSSGTRQNGSKP